MLLWKAKFAFFISTPNLMLAYRVLVYIRKIINNSKGGLQ